MLHEPAAALDVVSALSALAGHSPCAQQLMQALGVPAALQQVGRKASLAQLARHVQSSTASQPGAAAVKLQSGQLPCSEQAAVPFQPGALDALVAQAQALAQLLHEGQLATASPTTKPRSSVAVGCTSRAPHCASPALTELLANDAASVQRSQLAVLGARVKAAAWPAAQQWDASKAFSRPVNISLQHGGTLNASDSSSGGGSSALAPLLFRRGHMTPATKERPRSAPPSRYIRPSRGSGNSRPWRLASKAASLQTSEPGMGLWHLNPATLPPAPFPLQQACSGSVFAPGSLSAQPGRWSAQMQGRAAHNIAERSSKQALHSGSSLLAPQQQPSPSGSGSWVVSTGRDSVAGLTSPLLWQQAQAAAAPCKHSSSARPARCACADQPPPPRAPCPGCRLSMCSACGCSEGRACTRYVSAEVLALEGGAVSDDSFYSSCWQQYGLPSWQVNVWPNQYGLRPVGQCAEGWLGGNAPPHSPTSPTTRGPPALQGQAPTTPPCAVISDML